MLKRISVVAVVVLATFLLFKSEGLAQKNLTAKANGFQPVGGSVESDRIRDGLVGPVRRVRTEVVKLTASDTRIVEGKRALLEVVAYDIKGNKTENQYFPVAGSTLTGKEVYKYDDKGNISEMTLVNDDGSLLSKETYKYEFDFAGNWNKMTTSVAVVDGGKFTFEPTEITYRSIMYYLDEKMVKMVQPEAQPKSPSPQSSVSESTLKTSAPAPSPVETSTRKQPISSEKAASLPPQIAADKLNLTNAVELKSSPSSSTADASMTLDSDPPPMPVARPILKPVSGGVLNGTAISLPSPTYPEAARRMRTAGTVTVEVVIGENGKVISAETNAGPVALRDAAVQAARKARFSPTMLSGQPVKVSGVINYKFTLAQ